MTPVPSTMLIDTIHEDRPCQSCGYNLRGLATSSKCPECGTPISRLRKSRRNIKPVTFSDLPPSTIRRFMPGFYLATLACAGVFVLTLGGVFMPLTDTQYLMVMTATVALWAVGAWLMMAPIDIPAAAEVGFSRSCRIRAAARWLQVGWLVEWGAIAIIQSTGVSGGLESAIYFLGVMGGLTGLVGAALLAVMLARFAAWVCDDFAEKCFNFHFGGVAILTPIFFLGSAVAGNLLPIFMFFTLVVGGLWMLSLFALPVGLLSLSRSIGWSMKHSRERLAREQRLAARMAAEPALAPQPTTVEDLSQPIHVSDEAVHRDINYSGTIPIEGGDQKSAKSSPGVGRRVYDHEAGDASHPQRKHDQEVF